MKKIYTFDVTREIVKEVPHVKKTKSGPVETTKKVKEKIKNEVCFVKPTISEVEDAEFFYGQKYNEYINAGFLTKAMLAKKMGDNGGLNSKLTSEKVSAAIKENMDAARTIEFFAGAKDLNEEQQQRLDEAKKSFIETRTEVHEYEMALNTQFSQTADAKAENKLVEWFVLMFSYYEEEVGEEKTLFPFFEGDSYDEKRKSMLALQEDDDDDIDDPIFLKHKILFDEAFEKLIQVVSIWYNKIGENQESIDKALKDLFTLNEDEQPE
jgi:hypothetical protein|tara:strand:- start:863 stop:1663 length:801 start_codon:yes stop_codon:yes gene_type:complete